MARHAKTASFHVEAYRLLTPPSDGPTPPSYRKYAAVTEAYVDRSAAGALDTTYSRPRTRADLDNLSVLDSLVLRNTSDATADPTSIATMTLHSVPSGSRLAHPVLRMPAGAPGADTISRKVTYTLPQVARFIRRSSSTFYTGGNLSIDEFIARAVNVAPAEPAHLAGYQHVALGDPRWTDKLFTPGHDLDFDMAWLGFSGISSALTLTFEV